MSRIDRIQPNSIRDEELEENVWKALSLTAHEVIPDHLQACNRLKKEDYDWEIQIQETETKNPYLLGKYLQ